MATPSSIEPRPPALPVALASLIFNSSDISPNRIETSTHLFSTPTLKDIASHIPNATSSTQNVHEDADRNIEPFQMSYGADVAWTVIFSLMIGNAIIGNSVVLWIVLGKRMDYHRCLVLMRIYSKNPVSAKKPS